MKTKSCPFNHCTPQRRVGTAILQGDDALRVQQQPRTPPWRLTDHGLALRMLRRRVDSAVLIVQ